MRDRDELSSLIKDFVADDHQKGPQKAAGDGYDESVHLIGGDLRAALLNKQNPIEGENVIDPLRSPDTKDLFMGAAKSAHRLVLEIGSARGQFCTELAARDTEDVILACEVRSALVKRIQKRRTRRKLDNLYLMLGDVRLHLLPLLEDGPIFDEIYILFPDPWWKRRHRKRRLFQPGFLEFLTRAVKPEGVVVLKTDVLAYREVVKELIRDNPLFVIDERESSAGRAKSAPFSRRQSELTHANLPVHTLLFRRP